MVTGMVSEHVYVLFSLLIPIFVTEQNYKQNPIYFS